MNSADQQEDPIIEVLMQENGMERATMCTHILCNVDKKYAINTKILHLESMDMRG